MSAPQPAEDLAAQARELYAVSRADFIAARNARVAELKASGAADDAAAVKAFAKPSAAADAANRLARDDADLLERILALGREFRAAQAGADRAALRELGSRRNRLLRDVTSAVAGFARADRPSGAGADELKQTVLAAIADAAAAEALSSGRLVRGMSSDGLSPVDLSGAVAGPPITVAAPTGDEPAPIDTSLARRRAKKELARAEAAAGTARTRVEDAETAWEEADRQLEAARRAVAEAEERASAARAERDRARDEGRAAKDRLRDARAELDGL